MNANLHEGLSCHFAWLLGDLDTSADLNGGSVF